MTQMSKLFCVISIIFILSGCASHENINVTNEMNNVITQHIKDHYKNVYGETDKQFEAHKVYGAEERNGMINVYIYSLYKEFNQGGTVEQSGHSLPALIRLKKEDEKYIVKKYKEPEDGERFLGSLKAMFPRRYVDLALQDTGNLPELHVQIDEEVQQWQKETNEN